jgi:N-methylhydantoinase B
MGVQAVLPDERFVAYTSTGGGYGDPFDRDPDAVRDDVRADLVSDHVAREVYGVVIDTDTETFAVDSEATGRLREARGARPA